MLQETYETVDLLIEDLLKEWLGMKKKQQTIIKGELLRTFDDAIENCKMITIKSNTSPTQISYIFDSTHCENKAHFKLERFIFKEDDKVKLLSI